MLIGRIPIRQEPRSGVSLDGYELNMERMQGAEKWKDYIAHDDYMHNDDVRPKCGGKRLGWEDGLGERGLRPLKDWCSLKQERRLKVLHLPLSRPQP